MKRLRIHYFQHVPFEGIGHMEEWANSNGHQLSGTRFYDGEYLPRIEDIDWLIVMGGPMDIYQDGEYPWLAAEKRFIKQAVDSGKVVLGFCLGGQLIAHVLGAKVNCGEQKEIGWHPVLFTEEAKTAKAFTTITSFPSTVFHWHQDMFGIPQGAVRMASSFACQNQAFIFNDTTIAFQFHLETTAASMRGMLANCASDLATRSEYVQTTAQILDGEKHIATNNRFLKEILDQLASM